MKKKRMVIATLLISSVLLTAVRCASSQDTYEEHPSGDCYFDKTWTPGDPELVKKTGE